ncbi:hypothetical protein [Microseira wollei]|uniref:Uncharacterized protein n=1 Tax=Microseira wollei NIES-4236 TaxID=2530354 RepID=A0AAV3XMH8_9CYAN|nr:hypothetical protein [Microseira wollei]GET42876.1 hypothetical protein MiSe_76940 [Microseira wollei NIES-4236]
MFVKQRVIEDVYITADGVTTPSKARAIAFLRQLAVKKDGVILVNKPHQLKMFPQFYQIHRQQQLKNTEDLTLKVLIYLLQSQKQVSITLGRP